MTIENILYGQFERKAYFLYIIHDFVSLSLQTNEQEVLANYQTYVDLDDLQLVPNPEAFTCPICFDDVEEKEGIMLQECLHMFCK